MQRFDLLDLLCNVPGDYSTEPQVYTPTETKPFITHHVSVHESNVLVSTENDKCHDDLKFRALVDYDYDKLKKARHEIVASLWQRDTDIKLKDIDPYYDESVKQTWHGLSPDGFDEESRRLIELGTSLSSNIKNLKNEFSMKWRKYSIYMEDLEIQEYYVLIVSRNAVITNYPVTQEIVNTLCSRFIMGHSIETEIRQKCAFPQFSEDSQTLSEASIDERMIFKSDVNLYNTGELIEEPEVIYYSLNTSLVYYK